VDCHRFDADPDPNCHLDANPRADPFPSFTDVGKCKFFFKLLVTALPVYRTMFYFPHQCQRCHNFKYFGLQLFHIPGIDMVPTDLDLPDPDQHALDAESPILIRIRQDDADPTRSRSGSTTLVHKLFCFA
jgi:hypothetical protein